MPEHLPKWFKIITLTESRKVGFGVWLFVMANIFLDKAKIPAEIWVKCVFVSGALIGFGTILDRAVDKLADRWAGKYDPPQPPQVG